MRIRKKWIFAILGFVFITGPGVLSGTWSLFYDKPLWPTLKPHLGRITMPHFSPYCITIPLGLLMFGFAIWSDARQKRNVLVVLSSLKDAELHDQAAKWLTDKLSNKKVRVHKAALFGSVVHDHYPTSDVDVVVLFAVSSDRQITKIGRKIKGTLSNEFRIKFGHPLHVQLFHANESDRWTAFLTRAGKHEILPLTSNV